MFKINTIEFKNHPLFFNNKFDFSEPNNSHGNYNTLIIGSNGTGKSNLLKEIADLLITVIATCENENSSYISQCGAIMNVTFNNLEYVVSTEKMMENQLSYLPKKILALSYNLNDKYPFLTQKNKKYTDRYKYLGIRSASNNAFISKLRNNLIGNMSLLLQDIPKLTTLNKVFKKMDLPLSYKLTIEKGKNFFDMFPKKEIDNNLFNKNLEILKKKILGRSKRFSDAKLKQLMSSSSKEGDEIKETIEISKLKKLIILFYQNNLMGIHEKKNQELTYNIDLNINNTNINDFIDEYEIIENLLLMEVLKIKELEVVEDYNYAYNESSSGEFHIINSISSIITHIENNSLILIDEPEVSLHPNWQVQYIEILNEIMENYNGCHLVITTHSHFLVSGLSKNNSSLITLKKDSETGNLIIKNIKEDTYGWSAENILYNVFGIATTRNSYFERDLMNLVELISKKSKDKEEIFKYYTKFKQFNITQNDPLYLLLEKTEKYMEEIR